MENNEENFTVELIKKKLDAGTKLTFAERNILNIYERKTIQKSRAEIFDRIKKLSEDKSQEMRIYSGTIEIKAD